MNKQTFLNKLRSSLKDLNENEIIDNLNEYESYIDEKIKSGKSEEEAVSELGDFKTLVSDIYEAYNVKKPKKGIEKYLSDFADSFMTVINIFINKSFKEKITFILEVLILIALILIGKIPVNILINGLKDFLIINFFGLGRFVFSLVNFGLEVIYVLASLWFIIYYFKKRYEKEFNLNVVKKIEKGDSKMKENKISNDKALNTVCSIILIFVKIFLGLMLIPLFALVIGILSLLVISIITIIDGASYYSIPILILAAGAFIYAFIYIIIKLLFDKNIKALTLLISFGLSIVLSVTGSVLVFYDVAKSEFINDIPSNYEYTYKEYDTTNNNILIDSYYIEYKEDESLGNNIKINLRYVDDYNDVEIKDNNSTIEINYYDGDDEPKIIKDVFKLFYDNYCEHTYYNYEKLFGVKATITANKKNIKIIKENNQNYHRYDYYDDDDTYTINIDY